MFEVVKQLELERQKLMLEKALVKNLLQQKNMLIEVIELQQKWMQMFGVPLPPLGSAITEKEVIEDD